MDRDLRNASLCHSGASENILECCVFHFPLLLSHAVLEVTFTLHISLWIWEDCSMRIAVSPALTQDGRQRYTVLRSPYLKRIFCVTLHT